MYDLLWPILLVPIIAVVACEVIRNPSIRGAFGEWMVDRLLRHSLPESHFTVLRDITLPSRDGTTQIDHVVISRYGIFVIETKHLSGWLFGSERDSTWTQTFRRTRVSFQNPLRQNIAHVKTLEELLALPSAAFRSVVALAGAAEFKTELPAQVVKLNVLLDHVKGYTEVVIPPERIPELVARVESTRLKNSRQTRAAHVAALKTRHGSAKGPAEKATGLIRQIRLTFVAIKAAVGIAALGLVLFLGNQAFRRLSEVLQPVGVVKVESKSAGTNGILSPESSQPPTTPSASISSLTESLFPRTTAKLEQRQEHARAGSEEREIQHRLTWEKSLMCAYSVDTGRCACYEPKGPKADVSPDLCMSLTTNAGSSPGQAVD